MRGLSINCRLCSLLRCFKVQTFIYFCRTRKLTLPGWLIKSGYNQSSFRSSSLNLLRSILNLRAREGSFLDSRRVVYILHLPQIGWRLNPSLFKGLIPNLGTVKPAYPRYLSLESGQALSHSQGISLLLDFLLRALSLYPGELRLFLSPQGFILGPLHNVLGPLCLGQLLL